MTIDNPEVLAEYNAELVRLQGFLAEKWIPFEQFVKLLDANRDGIVDRDELFDTLGQFGLLDQVDPNKLFDHLLEKEGNDSSSDSGVKPSTILELLQSVDKSMNESWRTPIDVRQSNNWKNFGNKTKLVALVAHNNLKSSMMKFVRNNLRFFEQVSLVTTGSTGRAISALGLNVDTLVSSGPLGGDQEIGGLISKGQVAAVFFFVDPLSSHPHNADIQALNRICCVHDTMFANNPSTAEALVYSLEHSVFGFTRLTGHNPDAQDDTSVVAEYKENQKKVISDVQNNALQGSKGSVLRAFDVSKGSVLHAFDVSHLSDGSKNAFDVSHLSDGSMSAFNGYKVYLNLSK